METWLPPVITGVFSIAVVVLGAVAIELREQRKHAVERGHAAKAEQREAVATYIKELRTATEQWEKDRAAADRGDSAIGMHFEWWDALSKCLTSYLNAGVYLDLELTDLNVRAVFDKIDQRITGRYYYYSGELQLNTERSWGEINLAKPMNAELDALILELAKTARENLH